MQWCMPFGVLTPASWIALNATRYMHQYGVTSADFGRAVVQLREYAATNPDAWGTRADHAGDLTSVPVEIAAASGAGLFEQEIASDHYLPDLSVMAGSVALAQQLFAGNAGYRREDIDAAMIYDAFSPILLMQLEALGFCDLGAAKDFVADGNLALDGALPCNTNGGLIGEGYIHGLNLVLEATRQLRGTAVNQVANARAVLVTASRTGAILTRD